MRIRGLPPALPAILLILLASGPATERAAAAEHPGVRLSVLEYHPYPDPLGDPFGIPEPGAVNDSFQTRYRSYWFPTTVIDGVVRFEGATSFTQTYDDYRAAILSRLRVPAPLQLDVEGTIAANVSVAATVTWQEQLPSQGLLVRGALFEDLVPFEGGNGVVTHRFTVRAILAPQPFAGATGPAGDARFRWESDLPADVVTGRLGAVVFVVAGDSTGSIVAGEVLQSSTYRFAQTAATFQRDRSVLLEMWTATWCAACVFGDGAVDQLANEFGVARPLGPKGWSYLRATSAPVVLVATILGAALAGLLHRSSLAAAATAGARPGGRRRPPSGDRRGRRA